MDQRVKNLRLGEVVQPPKGNKKAVIRLESGGSSGQVVVGYDDGSEDVRPGNDTVHVLDNERQFK